MSDVSQGPGWWQARDEKWYPPELHPAYQPPPTTIPEPVAQPPQASPLSGGQPPHIPIPQPSARPPQVEKALEAKGYIRSLYDFSFSSLITLRVIRVLYILITILYSLGALVVFVSLLTRHSAADIVIAIIGVPIVYFIYLTVARIGLEILMVVFNIGKDVRVIRERTADSLGDS